MTDGQIGMLIGWISFAVLLPALLASVKALYSAH
jgi:hypothetical protein